MESLSQKANQLCANYFNVRVKDLIFKYKIDTTPTIPGNQVGLLLKILNKTKKELNEKFKAYQVINFTLYSTTSVPQEIIFTDIMYDNIAYKFTLNQAGTMNPNNLANDREAINFLGRFIKNLQGRLDLKRIGKKYFKYKTPIDFPQWKVKVWPGYATSFGCFGNSALINIDSSFKVLRDTTVLEVMEDAKNKFQSYSEKIREELIGMTIMTKYNNMMYRIDDIDFDRTPRDTFSTKEGKTISFIEYYETKYNKKLSSPKQPLLINRDKKDSREIILIPELCLVTGLSNDMRNNFNLMKDLSKTTKPDPARRMEEASRLIKIILESSETKEYLKKWGIHVEIDPLKITGMKISAGNMLMRNNNSISLENTPDLDRKIQAPMYSQPPIGKWALFCPSRDKDTYQTFIDNLKEATKTYEYDVKPPGQFFVDGCRFEDWRRVFDKNLNESVQAVVLLLPGPKKQAPLYTDIKRYFLTQCPIPSQVVLLKTIQAGKNTRSICNKILMQICAKVGGQPWIVDELPLTKEPAMVIGIDVYHKTTDKKQSILAFCATTDSKFSKYWSTVREQTQGQEIGNRLFGAVIDAIKEFKIANKGIVPVNMIVFRDGVSSSQRSAVRDIEIKSFEMAFKELIEKKEINRKPNLIFVCANKTVGAKFYTGDNLMKPGVNLKNPEQGTIIDQKITEGRDFYLISQKTTQGTATPTHYFILGNYREANGKYEDVPLGPDLIKNIETLTYKMCYLYYNWTGSVKVPAPIQYAHKLSNLIGDRWRSEKPIIPNLHFQKSRSLYFI